MGNWLYLQNGASYQKVLFLGHQLKFNFSHFETPWHPLGVTDDPPGRKSGYGRSKMMKVARCHGQLLCRLWANLAEILAFYRARVWLFMIQISLGLDEVCMSSG